MGEFGTTAISAEPELEHLVKSTKAVDYSSPGTGRVMYGSRGMAFGDATYWQTNRSTVIFNYADPQAAAKKALSKIDPKNALAIKAESME